MSPVFACEVCGHTLADWEAYRVDGRVLCVSHLPPEPHEPVLIVRFDTLHKGGT